MDTAWKVSQISEKMGYPVVCVGVPKTVDNDLPLTDCCPGFGSVAKYVATSMREAGYDVASMARTSTKIFVLEVMGRHAGWITAACGLAAENAGEPPHILLFPEVPFDPERFVARVDECVKQYGYCTIAVSEGLSDASAASSSPTPAPRMPSGIRSSAASARWSRNWSRTSSATSTTGRSPITCSVGPPLASRTDVEQAHALGVAAVNLALQGKTR